jgi:hypothetical protein
MGYPTLDYDSATYRGREKQQKTKREWAEHHAMLAQRLEREATEEEARQASLIAEYGQPLK